MRKVVSNAGEHDGTEVYYYKSGWRIAQVDDGSGDMAKQYIHGTQYIDEVVMMRAAGRGDVYIHQDANWNVIAATDLGGNVVERYSYTPYGELFVDQLTAFGDRDGDADVDATDKGTPGTTCTTLTGACRILDLDFDGDYDSADATLFDALDQGLARHPGRSWSGVGQELGHQGLLGTVAISGLQNRHREYGPARSVFLQRDHLATRNVAAGSFPDGMHLYHYARGNPLRYVDPRGLACGSGLSDFIVPDNIAGRDVTACCQAHDRCYETCGASRMGCDQALAQCIMARCNDPRDCGIVPIFPHMFFNILVRGNCGRGAAVFYSAVRMYGKGAFDAAQEGCTEPPPDECGSECIWSCMGGNPFAPELDVPCYDSCSAGCPGNVNDVQIVNPGW